jgi:hypothetical protein
VTLLKDQLFASAAQRGTPARVVMLSSTAHMNSCALRCVYACVDALTTQTPAACCLTTSSTTRRRLRACRATDRANCAICCLVSVSCVGWRSANDDDSPCAARELAMRWSKDKVIVTALHPGYTRDAPMCVVRSMQRECVRTELSSPSCCESISRQTDSCRAYFACCCDRCSRVYNRCGDLLTTTLTRA